MRGCIYTLYVPRFISLIYLADIIIGFEKPSYTFKEPNYQKVIFDEVYLAKKDNVKTEQSIIVIIAVDANTPSPDIQPASLSDDSGDNDYNLGHRQYNWIIHEIPPYEQRHSFSFRLFGDKIHEGTEAFQVYVVPHESKPDFPVNPLSQSTFIIIEDNE